MDGYIEGHAKGRSNWDARTHLITSQGVQVDAWCVVWRFKSWICANVKAVDVVNVAIDTVLRQCQRTCGWTYRRTDVRYEIRGRMKWSVVKRKETHLQWYLCSRSAQQRQWQNMPTEPNSIPWFRLERKKKEIEIRKRKASGKHRGFLAIHF